jgi:hypothetical protein
LTIDKGKVNKSETINCGLVLKDSKGNKRDEYLIVQIQFIEKLGDIG